jgi:WS/DGAT/MGAT family acyltransferase
MGRAAVNNVSSPFRLAKAVSATLPGLSQAMAKGEHDDVESTDSVPDTRFNRPVSPHRVFEAVKLELKKLSEIRKAVPGATVNDVVLTICGGALREYLDAKGELPAESLVAMAPVNTRVAGEEVTGNVLATMFVPVHSDIADPVARLRAVKNVTANAKEMRNAVGARQMTDLTRHIPASTQALAGRLITGLGLGYRTLRMCNCTVTNVPGPQQPMYLNGAKLILSTGAGPVIDGMGLIITAISYDGTIVFSITGCRKIVPDPEFLSACLSKSFKTLRRAAKKSMADSENVGAKKSQKKPRKKKIA